MKINLLGSDQKGLSVKTNNQASENCYIKEAPDGFSPIALVSTMGSDVFASDGNAPRGCREVNGVAYFVIGTSLYSVSSAGVKTSLGTIPGSGKIWMTDDGTNVIVVNGTSTGYYYNTSTAAFSSIALPGNAYTIDYLDTYVAFSSDNRRWYLSAVNDTDSFDSLDFALKSKSPDDLVALIEDHSEFILFGKKTIEPWFNSADVDFAFSQNTAGVIDRGCAARFSIAKNDNTLFFLGDDYIVYRLQGYQPVRISNDSIETRISNEIKNGNIADVEAAFAFIYIEHGHKFYQLTIPNRFTAVYNIATQQWHTQKHFDYETHHANCYCFCYGKHLIGSITGGVYYMSRDLHVDGPAVLKRVRRSNVFNENQRLVKWKSIRLVVDSGSTSVLSGQGSDPEIVVRWSEDSGRTWKNERKLKIGASGDYLKNVITRNCGASRARVLEIYQTDPVPFFIVDAYADVSI